MFLTQQMFEDAELIHACRTVAEEFAAGFFDEMEQSDMDTLFDCHENLCKLIAEIAIKEGLETFEGDTRYQVIKSVTSSIKNKNKAK